MRCQRNLRRQEFHLFDNIKGSSCAFPRLWLILGVNKSFLKTATHNIFANQITLSMLDGTRKYSDTSPKIENKLNELIASLTPEQRLKKVCDLSDFVKQAVIAGIIEDYPNITEDEIRLRYVARTYGNEISSRFFNWNISEKGY